MRKVQVFFLIITIPFLIGNVSRGQITILSDGFENTSTVFNISGGAFYTGTSTALDRPSAASFYAEGSYSYGVNNGTATLLSSSINTTNYASIQMTLRLASFSIGSTNNGTDGSDYVRIEISPDGGTNYYNTIQINGNNNACWSYTGGTGIASTSYDGNTSTVSFAPSGGGVRTADGYSTIKITDLPSVANLIIKITLYNNHPAERWLIDGLKVTGELSAPPTKLVITNINNGKSPSVNTPFNVIVEAQDNSNISQNVINNTSVILSLASGTGSLGGTLTRAIPSGSSAITFSNITYDKTETGVSIKSTVSSGDILASDVSSSFTVLDAASKLSFIDLQTAGQANQYLNAFNVGVLRSDNSIDSNFIGEINLNKISGTGNISGTLTNTAIAGAASFNDIKFDEGGVFILSASSPGIIEAVSPSINILSSSLPLSEDFNYLEGTSLSSNGWIPNSGIGVNSVMVSPGSLTYSNYASSGIGNKVELKEAGEDLYRSFNRDSLGSIYPAFLVNISSASKTGDYFITLSSNSQSSYFARVFAKDDGDGNLLLGIAKADSAVYAEKILTYNTTHLIVLKYSFNPTAADDITGIYIDPIEPGTEPKSFDAQGIIAETDARSLSYIILRQGNASYAPELAIDGIRIASSWEKIPLPVELLSFSCKAIHNKVFLEWSTATELNNFGFDIERSFTKQKDEEAKWTKIGFVNGHGNSNIIQKYSFADNTFSSIGLYKYRLKQIDNDGSFKYSNVVETEINIPLVFSLNQNYPNPFNPATIISFSLPEDNFVLLKVYNVLGQEVRTVLKDFMKAGSHKIKFNADDLSNGVYFYKLLAGNHSDTKRMLILK